MKTVSEISILIFLLFALITSVTTVQPALAKDTHETQTAPSTARSTQDKDAIIQDWLVVPVFFATNRTSQAINGIDSYSEKANPNGLTFGVINLAVPLPYNAPVDDASQTKMQWQRMHVAVKKHTAAPEFDKDKCTIQNKVFSRDEIVPAFNAYRQSTGNPETVIYVHGCCTTFDTVMRRAAMVASHTQTPVLAYDWVSPTGLRNYLVNQTMADQTKDDFCKFLTKVETLIDPKTTTLIAHSMGNQLVDEAMVRRAELMSVNPSIPKYKELVMSNADVDAIAFLKHGEEFAINGEKTRIYFSTFDKRLRLSTFVHGGFKRVGMPGDLLPQLIKIKDTECIDITANNTGHELPYWLVANMHKYNGVGPARGFELKQQPPGYLLLVRGSNAHQEVADIPTKCDCGPKHQ